MIPETENNETAQARQDEIRESMSEKIRGAIRLTMMETLEMELEAYIGAGRYERKASRRDHRIGHRKRDWDELRGD